MGYSWHLLIRKEDISMPNHITTLISAGTKGEVRQIIEALVTAPLPKAPSNRIIQQSDMLAQLHTPGYAVGFEKGVDFNIIMEKPQELLDATSTSTFVQLEAVAKYLLTLSVTEANKRIQGLMATPYTNVDILSRLSGTNQESVGNRLSEVYHRLRENGVTPNPHADSINGELLLTNVETYGYFDWYNWSVDNWGTKWNAYETIIGDDVIGFDTAWSHPEPIIAAISKQLPTVEMFVYFADEDLGSNCGKYTIRNGEITSSTINNDLDNPTKFAESIKGYSYSDFDD